MNQSVYGTDEIPVFSEFVFLSNRILKIPGFYSEPLFFFVLLMASKVIPDCLSMKPKTSWSFDFSIFVFKNFSLSLRSNLCQ